MAFTITQFHIELLKNSRMELLEGYNSGLPIVAQDAKRPYGSKYILEDLAKIYLECINLEYSEGEAHELLKEEDGYWFLLRGDRVIYRSEELKKVLEDGLREMETVFEILLSHVEIGVSAGETYERSNPYDSKSWKRIS